MISAMKATMKSETPPENMPKDKSVGSPMKPYEVLWKKLNNRDWGEQHYMIYDSITILTYMYNHILITPMI